ncbi:hypothetical protein C922_00821 [Plasmodium inui San Antonio 1]|uniref:Uncharacterized protein n=1 Tax=Plasmodium inui San Antonio 1 TaxID=1237626 RepID=W7AJW4_9APIC|nr:hypothetical protein C922_00821 [Plasmodium inui San Antonio 1]EUD69129.1 hypothetical protein C922_00821 [Plasmodium inui San Antonio 1]
MHSAGEGDRSDPVSKDDPPQDMNNLEDGVGEMNPRTSGTPLEEEEEKGYLKREAEEDVSSLHQSEMMGLYFPEMAEEDPKRGTEIAGGNVVVDDAPVDDDPVDRAADGTLGRHDKDDDRRGGGDKATPEDWATEESPAELRARGPSPLHVREEADIDRSLMEEKHSSCTPRNDTWENSYQQVNLAHLDFTEADSNPREEMHEGRSEKSQKSDKSEDGKMKLKVQNLLKLIGLLKAQINQKDHEIYQMELDFKLKTQQCERSSARLNELLVENESFSDNTEGLSVGASAAASPGCIGTAVAAAAASSAAGPPGEGDFLMRKMKNILISQNEEIVTLNEELKKKNKELFYLNEENMTKNEKLAELKKEIEKNYMHLREYKSVKNEMEVDANNKVHRVENCLNVTNQKLLQNDIYLKEKKLNIEKQKRVIKELYNQLNKKEEQITELRSIIESIELNNNRDIIKYKQSNTDLINRLMLKKSCEVEKLQDRLLDYESKLLIYENNNEIKILKKNEDHLRKLLSKHIHRNEKLLNTTLLLQKSTLENNTLEKKIIELKAKTYRKDQEIKKLQESKWKKKNSIKNSSISQTDEVIELSDDLKDLHSSGGRGRRRSAGSLMHYSDDYLDAGNHMLDYTSRAEKNNALDAMLLEGESHLMMGVKDDSASAVSLPLGTPLAATGAVEDDPVYVALCEFSHSLKETNIPFQIRKVRGSLYLLNDKEVLIKFINGDLYVEDGPHLVKLNDFLLSSGLS